MSSTLRLPFAFDVAQLETDLAHCLALTWPAHFNSRDYAGQWTSIALRSASGQETDIASVPGQTGYRDTPLLTACAYFRQVVGTFQCDKESIRLLRLGPGSRIHVHRDPGADYADGFFRIHIPLTTNDRTYLTIDGRELQMRPGECWYANFSRPHSARNEGATDRVHLVIDACRNTWSDGLFRTAGYDFEREADARAMDAETTRRVIAELRARGTVTDLRLAETLEQTLRRQ